MQHKALTSSAIAAALLVLPLTACGSDDSGGQSGDTSGADLVVHAKDTLKFDRSEYETPAGDIKVAYVDDGTITHSLVVENHSGFRLQVDKNGQVATGTVNLPEGTYTIYCDIPSHRSSGMEAKLTVTASSSTAS